MPQEQNPGIKLRHLKIENFKALDSLELDFPAPRFPDEPDVVVLGSKNGLGKTSVLEACVLLYLTFILRNDIENYHSFKVNDFIYKLHNLFVKSGSNKLNIEGTIFIENECASVRYILSKTGKAKGGIRRGDFKNIPQNYLYIRETLYQTKIEKTMHSLLGFNTEPCSIPGIIYFHSNRKVQEGNPKLGIIVDRNSSSEYSKDGNLLSTFKLEILQAMMSKVGLFENLQESTSLDVIVKLNFLMERYTNGNIEKLRSMGESAIEFRVTPKNSNNSYPFDSLSSGQKEIVSTLFLIWLYTKDNPGIVLIDEPELHLNAEWQRDFVQQLYKIAPNNQYILATHSEDIVDSVPQDRRFLLVPQEAGKW